MDEEGDYSPEQRLLMWIRDKKCGGVAAELARKIDKDATYVNRLLYPIGKAGRKGIGLEIMKACSDAFELPPGFWDQVKPAEGPFTHELMEKVRALNPAERVRVENAMRALFDLTPLEVLTRPAANDEKQSVAEPQQYLQPNNDDAVTSGYSDPKKGSAGRARLKDVKTPKPTRKKGHASTKHQRAARPKGGGRT